jgi:hypothetical protein
MGGLSTAKIWIIGISITAISVIMYNMFSKLQYYLSDWAINTNVASVSTQMTLNAEYNWAFIITGVGGIVIPILWTFWREGREREQ